MESNEIRSRFLKFFEKRGHKIIPSASLVPENDPSVLFNTAGMQPLVPYLLGQDHPMGVRLVNVQKCVRTQDIDEVGDNTHDTFFEMMGNWSLGDYFKEEAIKWSYEFLTSKDEGLGLDISRLYVTVFEGDENAPKDTEAFNIWKKYIPENRIYYMSAKSNWWSAGDNGPCGPDTEMFYDVTEGGLGDLTKEEYIKADSEQKVVEIWNDVFMEYEKKDGKVIGKLKKKNVDTGAGLERISVVMQKTNNIFDTDLFKALIQKIDDLSELKEKNVDTLRLKRIIADHIRTAAFMIADGVIPSNNGRGYILRRLLRRAIRSGHALTMKNDYVSIVELIDKKYGDVYHEIHQNKKLIIEELEKEFKKFIKTLEKGLERLNFLVKKKENEAKYATRHRDDFGSKSSDFVNAISGKDAFDLYQSYGFPFELIKEELAKHAMFPHEAEFRKEFEEKAREHQEKSRTASAGMFKGGLANHNEKTIQLHTAHHLLLAALQAIVGKQVKQRGSNITEERLRIDFLCDHKLTDEEKKKVEDWVNDKIAKKLNVIRREMPLEEAHKIGAEMEFGAKYADIVSVYFIEDQNGNIISKEFCGGPHVKNTGELGHFKIQKEEAVAKGIRRIKGVLVV